MTTETTDRNNGRSNGGRGAGGRFGPGNPGRPRGARHKTTVAAETILERGARRISAKALAMALGGDVVALRLVMDRIMPVRRERLVTFDLPALASIDQHPAAIAELLAAMARGEIAPAEAEAVVRVLAEHRKALEVADLDARIVRLEEQLKPALKDEAA